MNKLEEELEDLNKYYLVSEMNGIMVLSVFSWMMLVVWRVIHKSVDMLFLKLFIETLFFLLTRSQAAVL